MFRAPLLSLLVLSHPAAVIRAETGGKYLSVWRARAESAHELVAETGILQARR